MDGREISRNLLQDPAGVALLCGLVRSRLGAAGAVTLSLPKTLHTSPVVFIHCDGTPRYVVKLFREFRRFTRAVSRLSYLSGLDLPVARLKHWSIAYRYTALRSYVLVQEYVEGRPLDVAADKSNDDLLQVASTLAALHSVSTRSLLGVRPSLKRGGYFRRGPYVRFFLRQTLRCLDRIRDRLEPAVAESILQGLHSRALPLWQRSRYELLHGDVKPPHYLLTDHGAVVVDLDQAHFGDFVYDLVFALHVLCENDEEKTRLFLQRYFQQAQGTCAAEYREYEPFYHGDFHLRTAAYWVLCLEQGSLSPEAFRPLFQREVEECCQVLNDHSANQADSEHSSAKGGSRGPIPN